VHPFAKLIRNPLLVLGADGCILEANSEADRSFAAKGAAAGAVFADRAQLAELIGRASGSGDTVLGVLDMRSTDGRQRFRVTALALRDREPIAYAIEFRQSEEDEFAALTERLRDLNDELHARRRAQAQVEEALSHNRILYRELQHRVKNNLQMLLALVSAAGRESADPGQKLFVQTLHSKLSALFDAQRLMYADQNAAGVRADQMLNSIADTVQVLSGSGVSIAVNADPLAVPNDTAFPLALIANELLTNAIKYGCPPPAGRVQLKLTESAKSAVLEVRDEGPGFDPATISRASSGLGLVRGLCRQIGGRLDVHNDGGTSAIVTFPLSEVRHDAF